MFSKDTPNFNAELIRWLIAYFLSRNKKTETIYEQLINLVKITPAEFRDIINEMIINGYIIKNTKKIYAQRSGSKKVLEITNYQHFYSMTQEGEKQLDLGWELAGSAIPKELWNDALEKISLIRKSLTPPFNFK